jgi:hypothetical protein
MKERRIRPRSVALLVFAVLLALAAGASDAGAGRRRAPSVSSDAKECYYGGGVYSLGACRTGQRCVRGVNDEDYWEDDPRCSDTSSGGGGMMRV